MVSKRAGKGKGGRESFWREKLRQWREEWAKPEQHFAESMSWGEKIRFLIGRGEYQSARGQREAGKIGVEYRGERN